MDLLLTFQETENYTFKDKLHKYIFWKVNYFQTWVRKDLLDFDTTCSVEFFNKHHGAKQILVYILSKICFACDFAKNFQDVIKIRNAI